MILFLGTIKFIFRVFNSLTVHWLKIVVTVLVERTATITNAQVGDIISFLSQTTQTECNIIFEQTSGDGATDCDIVCNHNAGIGAFVDFALMMASLIYSMF